MLLTVHDELVFEVPEAGRASFKRWVKNEMEPVYTLAVPLVVDVGSGDELTTRLPSGSATR